MSQKLYEENNIQDIANAIRSKNGTQNSYTVAQMGNAIRAIKTQPNLESLIVNQNGTYEPSSGKDGFSIVNVDVDQEGREPVIESLEITENGTYEPPSGVDGYGPVTVEIETPSGIIPSLVSADNFYYQDVNPLNAFGNHEDNWWGSASAGTHYLSIKFYEPKEITQVKFHNAYIVSNYHWCSSRITFQGSNDGTTWINLFDADNLTDDADAEYTEAIQNSNEYEYYRFICYSNASYLAGIGRVQLDISGGNVYSDVFCLLDVTCLSDNSVSISKDSIVLEPYSVNQPHHYFIVPDIGEWTVSSSNLSLTINITVNDFWNRREIDLANPEGFYMSTQYGDYYKYYSNRTATRILQTGNLVFAEGMGLNNYVAPCFYSLHDYGDVSNVLTGYVLSKKQISISNPENESEVKIVYIYGSMSGAVPASDANTQLYDINNTLLCNTPGITGEFYAPRLDNATVIETYNAFPLNKRIAFYQALLRTE